MPMIIEEKSLELALVKAAGQLGITQDELAYKVINQSSGFLGVFGKKIAVEVWKKGSKDHQRLLGGSHKPQRHPDMGEDKKPLSSKEVEALVTSLRVFCEGICQHMLGEEEEIKVSATLKDDRLVIDIDSDYLAAQVQKNSRLTEALEHILRKRPRHIKQELPFRIFVDVKGMRQSRESELVDMAQDLSNKVHENKRPIVLNYRSSYDRKIIHMALDKDERVYTKSIGSGPNRKLMILPSKNERQEATS